MSAHLYLCCEQTSECTEVIKINGSKRFSTIDFHTLQAYLLYHSVVSPGSPFRVTEIETFAGENRNTVGSLEEASEELESIGSFKCYEPPVMMWTKGNHLKLLSRVKNHDFQLHEVSNIV